MIEFARRHRFVAAAAMSVCSLLLLAVFGFATVSANPAVAAHGAEVLRRIIGDENVARLETWVLGWQDKLQGWAFQAGGAQPQAPWPSPSPAAISTLVSSPNPSPVVENGNGSQLITPPPTAVPASTSSAPASTATPSDLLAPLKPMGHLAGEGGWSIYLKDPSGKPVAFRTYLEPDPQRAYAVAAVVAVDLAVTRLHFMLGSQEPASPATIYRPGRIPTSDIKSGLVVAAFNGGFKAEHGQFGAMVNGVVALAPRDGFGTVAMYDDGRVAIGSWGNDIFWSKGLRNWRQNGPLIVQNGRVNPHTADAAPKDWGYTLKGDTATWRSGLGISADGRTLYYIAGPYLTLPVLAQAMAATGAVNGIQLDINGYWVLFEAIGAGDGEPQTAPLLDGMKNDGRYIHTFERDFFYLTAIAN